MDISALADVVGLEDDEYRELLELFLQTTASHLEKLQKGIEVSESRGVTEAAHAIKGAAANLRLEAIACLAQAIELQSRNNCLEGAAEGARRIEDLCRQLAKEVTNS